MKTLVLGLALFIGTFTSLSQARSPVMYENWDTLATDAMVYSGNELKLLLPPVLVPVGVGPWGRVRHRRVLQHVTKFIVRIGPTSIDRGCELITRKAGQAIPIVFTSVSSAQSGTSGTLQDGEAQPSAKATRQGWMEYQFIVADGAGLPSSAVNVAFGRTSSRSVQCYFEVDYVNTAGAAVRAVEPIVGRSATPEPDDVKQQKLTEVDLDKDIEVKSQ